MALKTQINGREAGAVTADDSHTVPVIQSQKWLIPSATPMLFFRPD